METSKSVNIVAKAFLKNENLKCISCDLIREQSNSSQ